MTNEVQDDSHESQVLDAGARPPTGWTPLDPARWATLGLADPVPDETLPPDATPADALIQALCAPGAQDPVDGIVEAVRLELVALATLDADGAGVVLVGMAKRLALAQQLLRWTDGRERLIVDSMIDPPDEKKPESPDPSPSPARAPAA